MGERRQLAAESEGVRRHQPYLTLTEGNSADKDFIEARVVELAQRFKIKSLAYDRFGADLIKSHLMTEGLEVVSFGQGFVSMNAPTKAVDILVRSGKLRHGGHPVLRWNAANVMLKKDEADNWKPDKKRSREKIDGIVALVMAVGLANLTPPPPPPPPLTIECIRLPRRSDWFDMDEDDWP